MPNKKSVSNYSRSVGKPRFKKIGVDPQIVKENMPVKSKPRVTKPDIEAEFRRVGKKASLGSGIGLSGALRLGTAAGAMLYSPGLNKGEEEELKKFKKQKDIAKKKSDSKKRSYSKKIISNKFKNKISEKNKTARLRENIMKGQKEINSGVSNYLEKRNKVLRKSGESSISQGDEKDFLKKEMTPREKLMKYNDDLAQRILEKERIKSRLNIRKKIQDF